MEQRPGIFLQKGKTLSESELESVGRTWIRQLQIIEKTDKLMPYHYLRE